MSTPALSLPTETLFTIFNDVYCWQKDDERDWMERENGNLPKTDPTIFPFACAMVCRQWHAVLCLQAHYWTPSITIPLDSAQVSHEVIRDWITAAQAKDLPVFTLNIVYQRKVIMDHRVEQNRVSEVMEAICPLPTSIKHLTLHTVYRSSVLRRNCQPMSKPVLHQPTSRSARIYEARLSGATPAHLGHLRLC
ncbi:hypothetical protein CONPUDRAFT_136001 [Coniophora puteana RWD-64-598 SS2]|uniref:F-box domain-containing protein n=1 Tax=Coniophora puteana (strain RWD-64-598) TaxID=741705 RepID=A0A5M3MVU6_CONPW|nr:uncharacterized protein CONPUDRAFT_136001 [Coniophora puteana RWD-64-598 SS2]EIW82711.1 hypothetical protein CONPUDRAFT_136001 [Coniophora puteana RWD-64-598 SS2]